MWCPFPDVPSFQRSLFVDTINKDEVLTMQEFNAKLFKVIPYKALAVVYKDEKTKNGYNGVAIEVLEAKDRNYPIKTQ